MIKASDVVLLEATFWLLELLTFVRHLNTGHCGVHLKSCSYAFVCWYADFVVVTCMALAGIL